MNYDISKKLKTKAKTEKEKETVKPTVINDTLIREYLVTYNKENRIFDNDDMPLWELTHLSLSYKNIIEIDNLYALDKLQKLQLDNNIICKIQNLDHLVNLKWLDLSFNLIDKIEGLDKLTKLTDLSLFSNEISILSGLENLHELNIISVGHNKITDYVEAIKYLNNLKNKLQVLKMADNPFYKLKEAEYRQFAIAFLSNLKYLDYELIDDETREKALEKHKEELQELEVQKNQDNNEDEKEKLADPALKEAKIDCTVDMVRKILREDEDSALLQHLPKFQENFQNPEQNIDELTGKYQHEMKVKNKEKVNTIIYCEQVLKASERQAEQESIKLIEKFTSLRKHKFRQIQTLQSKDEDDVDYDQFEEELMKEIDSIEDELMAVEMKLQESLLLSTTDFQERVKKIIEDMKGKTGQFIKEVQEEMEAFNNNLRAHALAEYDRIANSDEDPNQEMLEGFSDGFVMLMEDKDILVSHIEASKENVDGKIGDKETEIVKALTDDWKSTENRIIEEQHHRNRTVVEEVIKTCNNFRDDIMREFRKLRGDDD